MQAFRVQGKFKMGHDWTTFATEVAAADEAGARDRVLSTIGSRHRVTRRQIEITGVSPLAASAVSNPAVAREISGRAR